MSAVLQVLTLAGAVAIGIWVAALPGALGRLVGAWWRRRADRAALEASRRRREAGAPSHLRRLS